MLPAIGRCAGHGRCGQATLAASRHWLMLPAIDRHRCRRVDAHMQRLLRSGLGWCCLPLSDFSCLMSLSQCAHAMSDAHVCRPQTIQPGHVWRRQTVVCRLWTMLAGHVRRRLTDLYRPRTIVLAHIQRRLTNVHRPYLTSAERCAKATTNAGSPRPMLPDRCRLSLADVACSIRTCHIRCLLVLVYATCYWPMSLARCPHSTSDACRPWLMPSAVGTDSDLEE